VPAPAPPRRSSLAGQRRVARPSARVATLHGYVELTRSLGADPERLLSAVRLRPADLADPDAWVPAATVSRLLELTAEESGREDVGLLLAQERRLSTWGRLSVVLREEPDLRSALELLIRYEHSLNDVIRLDLAETRQGATVTVWFQVGEPVPVRQAHELAVGALVGLVRMLREPTWQPRAVSLEHAAPKRPTQHRALLGPTVHFDQPFTGLVLAPGELDSPNTLAALDDPQLLTYARQLLQALPEPHDADLLHRVRELVQALLPVGRCTMARVARSLGTTPRTLHRHLAADGKSFAGIVDATRAGLAERYLAADRHSLTDVAYLLGFAAPSAFSRWFRRRFGCSPTEWRAAARSAG
jgi:AraC-like DNA-binding protein